MSTSYESYKICWRLVEKVSVLVMEALGEGSTS
jgi:hypothetical protein